jgi:hypothetical protein
MCRVTSKCTKHTKYRERVPFSCMGPDTKIFTSLPLRNTVSSFSRSITSTSAWWSGGSGGRNREGGRERERGGAWWALVGPGQSRGMCACMYMHVHVRKVHVRRVCGMCACQLPLRARGASSCAGCLRRPSVRPCCDHRSTWPADARHRCPVRRSCATSEQGPSSLFTSRVVKSCQSPRSAGLQTSADPY